MSPTNHPSKALEPARHKPYPENACCGAKYMGVIEGKDVREQISQQTISPPPATTPGLPKSDLTTMLWKTPPSRLSIVIS